MRHHRIDPDKPGAPETPPAAEPSAPADDARLAELEAELLRVKDAHLRAEADLQTVRRRAGKELDEAERRGEGRALSAYLTLIDDLGRALAAAEEAGDADAPLTAGVRLVLARASEELARLGVVRIDPHGEPFDPREHEALLSTASEDHPTGHVSQVVAPGYRHGERLLRPARVIVSHGPTAAPGDEAAAEGEVS